MEHQLTSKLPKGALRDTFIFMLENVNDSNAADFESTCTIISSFCCVIKGKGMKKDIAFTQLKYIGRAKLNKTIPHPLLKKLKKLHKPVSKKVVTALKKFVKDLRK